MLSNGQIIADGSWTLRVYLTDLQTERSLRVRGDLHIGGVMLKLVEELEISMDWSDHALWWPYRNIWLTRTKSTLDQCGVHADALLHFTPMHKNLKVQLPDLRYLDIKVDFSVKAFSAVVCVCKNIGIRHPEELSFCKPLENNHLKYNYKDLQKRGKLEQNYTIPNGPTNSPADANTFTTKIGSIDSTGSLDRQVFLSTPQKSPMSSPIISPMTKETTRNIYNFDENDLNSEKNNTSYDSSLAHSPPASSEAKHGLLKPKSFIERARMNVGWLDSSLSIMEQGIREFDTLCLRFKFYTFYDLNPKYDAVRINQIYEQSRWQLLNEEIDCTEEEMLMFAALQLQITLQAIEPQQLLKNGNQVNISDDDIDVALADLQNTLEGTTVSSQNDITQVPELNEELRFLKPKKYTLKAFKRYWFSCKDLHLYLYKSKEDMIHHGIPIHTISLKGCEITPDVNIGQNKFGIKLEVPSPEGMSEIYIRCDDEQQYSKWMAACRLASKGRSLADSSYSSEVKTILDFLQMQKPMSDGSTVDPKNYNIQPEDFVAPRHLRKQKGKLIYKILEAHANVKHLSLTESKLNYIRAWQSLPEYGVTLFIVRFMGSKKDELLGVAHNRLMKLDINSGDHLKTWRFNNMKAWNVNWEVKHMMVQFEDENIIFSCLSADCKVVHEYIGGYIFLSMRSKEANQALNEELFHKLTGGWV